MKHFNFAMKWHEILKTYSEDIRREVYDAVIEYAASGEIIEMQPLSRMAFDFIRYEIDEKARRKAARRAKKQQADNPQKAEQTRTDDVDKITDDYMAAGKAPEPETITINDTGSKVSIKEKHIRSLVKYCIQDLLSKGHKPEESKFASTLNQSIDNRLCGIRTDLASYCHISGLTDTIWQHVLTNSQG